MWVPGVALASCLVQVGFKMSEPWIVHGIRILGLGIYARGRKQRPAVWSSGVVGCWLFQVCRALEFRNLRFGLYSLDGCPKQS